MVAGVCKNKVKSSRKKSKGKKPLILTAFGELQVFVKHNYCFHRILQRKKKRYENLFPRPDSQNTQACKIAIFTLGASSILLKTRRVAT